MGAPWLLRMCVLTSVIEIKREIKRNKERILSLSAEEMRDGRKERQSEMGVRGRETGSVLSRARWVDSR